jgi:predicted GTPase
MLMLSKEEPMKRKVIIMGAAGRDFHNFNVFFRDNPDYEVVCFTAAQIPNIEGRVYPRELAGKLYPKGIVIFPEDELQKLVKRNDVDCVVLAYSDLAYSDVGHKIAIVNAAGADFVLMGPKSTQLKSSKPVISVCAVRTGAGKSPTSRRVCRILEQKGKKVVVVRHPMPYGDLKKQEVQRFSAYSDLKKNNCTIEEREEYEPHLEEKRVVYAGVDYEKILKRAEKEADIIVWDGGNNDIPFYEPDLHIVVADARRPGHEISYYPGETNARLADVVIINKQNRASADDIETVRRNIQTINPKAVIVNAELSIKVDNPKLIKGKTVAIVEDGPTLTHGGLTTGAGYFAAREYGCSIIDPRKYAVGSLKDVYRRYPLEVVIPAMGYSERQIKELEDTINKIDCDAVIIGTPVNLQKFIKIDKPSVRVSYELKEIGKPNLEQVLSDFLKK